MPFYQLHILDPKTGHTDRTHEFRAATDNAAIQHAETWAEYAPMELCRGVKRLKRWD